MTHLLDRSISIAATIDSGRNVHATGLRRREAAGFSVALAYAALAATRDVYLGGLIQHINPSAVAFIAFAVSTVVLLPIALAFDRDALGILRRHANTLLWVNITSAVGWLTFLGALRLIEPCLVQILYFGVSPLSILWIDRYVPHATAIVALTRAERPLFGGLFISLVCAGIIAVRGLSGLGSQPVGNSILGVLLALVGGVAMSVSTTQCRRLNDAGVGPSVMLSARYPLTMLAAGALIAISPAQGSGAPLWFSAIMAIAVLLILGPSYINQIAISLASPLTVRVVMASAPVMVFLLETIEGRLSPSFYSLAAAIFYAVFAVLAGVARHRAIISAKANAADRDPAQAPSSAAFKAVRDPGAEFEPSDAVAIAGTKRANDANIPGISDWRHNYPL